MSTHVELNPEVLEGRVRSELQRAQSRENGAKSRGPKTIAGWEKSKMNATKLGLRARTVVQTRRALGRSCRTEEAALRHWDAFLLCHYRKARKVKPAMFQRW